MTSEIKSTVWSRNDGRGPTYLGEGYRFIKTTYNYLLDCVVNRPTSCSPLIERGPLHTRVQVIGNRQIFHFFEALSVDVPFRYSGYLCSSCIMDWTIDEIVERLEDLKKGEVKIWVIPIILRTSWNFFSRDHIAVIVVKDGVVWYYDAKGIISENQPYRDGKSMREVVELCGKTLLGKYEVRENTETFQWDFANCGVYAAMFVYYLLVKKCSLEEFNEIIRSDNDLHKMRDFMIGYMGGEEEQHESSQGVLETLPEEEF